MKRKLLILLVLSVIIYSYVNANNLTYSCARAETNGTCGENITWTLNDDGVLSIIGTGDMINYSYTGSPFYNRLDITQINIGEGITRIGDYTFNRCSGIASIYLPESLKSIGHIAFYNCNNLNAVYISDLEAWLTVDFQGDFCNPCHYAHQLYIDGIEAIEITVPEGISSLNNYVFDGCAHLTEVILPSSLTSIANHAFLGCLGVENIHVSDDNSNFCAIDGVLYNKNADTIVCCPSGKSGDFIIPNNVTNIGKQAFIDCSKLTSIIIPNSVTNIGDGAFVRCSSLTSVSIPYGVNHIGNTTFSTCNKLSQVSLPNSITSIGNSAFVSCGSLHSIELPSSVTSIGEFAFESCGILQEITGLDNVTSIGRYAFRNCPATKYASIDSNGAKALGRAGYSFRIPNTDYDLRYSYINGNQNGLVISNFEKTINSIDIPYGVTEIAEGAGTNCASLISVRIPDSVISIGSRAFSDCINLSSISLPNSITALGEYVFCNCTSLTKIVIPSGITTIEQNTFYNCSSLESVTMPESIDVIGNSAFSSCSKLREIVLPETISSLGNFAFANCSELTSISIPKGLSVIGSSAFSGCSGLVDLIIPNSVTVINGCAFFECSNLTSVILSENLTVVDDYAFYGCSSLEYITLPESVDQVGDKAFYNCPKLAKFFITGNDTILGIDVISNSPIIYCYEYSIAEGWANEKGYSIVLLDNYNPELERSIVINEMPMLALGKSDSLKTTVFPSYDKPTIVWNSSDSSVISVADGVVTAHSTGVAVITATVGSASSSIEVRVYVELESFELSTSELWLVAKNDSTIEVSSIQPLEAEANITWTSSDTSLATVDETGRISTKRPGDVIITAISNNGIERHCLIHICYPVTEISFDEPDIELEVGTPYTLVANVIMRTQSCINNLISFTSSNDSIAIVNESGVVYPVGLGVAKITAKADSGIEDTCTVIVLPQGDYTIRFPDGLTIIDDAAFEDNDSIVTVTIPQSCSSIGAYAFSGCDRLVMVTFLSNSVEINDSAFEGCNAIAFRCLEDSTAAEFAISHGFVVVEML